MIAALPEPETLDIKALGQACVRGELDLIVVLGPTASGKTRYAVRLAKELGGIFSSPECSGNCASGVEIISADSRQVYRGMDIGTGKDLAEYDGVPYHLIDIRNAGEQYNVYEFREDFRKAYEDIRSRGAFPILCGGTGLYINSIVNEYDFKSSKPLSAPASPSTASSSTASSPTASSPSPSPSTASDLSVSYPTTIPSGRKTTTPMAPKNIFVIGTLVSREVRNARIDARLKARLKEGMVDEIRGLLDGSNPGCKDGRPVPAEVLLGYGLEYKFVTQYIKGELNEEELFLKLSTAIHQFAKRQMTWFRGMERSGVKIHWVQV